MAMSMKKLIMTVLVTVSLCTRMPFAAADPETSFVWQNCVNSEYRDGSAFQRNLNNVLESLVRKVSPSGFNISSVVVGGENSNSSVYGFVQCRGDLDSSDCEQCASMAKTILVQGCHNISGFVQLDGCFLRYENRSFYNDNVLTPNTPTNYMCNLGNSSRPQQFTNAVSALLSNVTAKAAGSPKLFATDSVAGPSSSRGNIYSLAQCWRYLSRTDCGSCLTFARETLLFGCHMGAPGAQYGSDKCYLRYEVYEFFTTSVLSPPPAESPPSSSEGKRPRVLGISLSVVAFTIVLIAAIGFWKWNFFSRAKRREEIYRTGGPELAAKSFYDASDKLVYQELFNYFFTANISRWLVIVFAGVEGDSVLMPTIANPELIFKFDILRESTSNFKAENKLGEGGFGSVFKGVLPDGREVAVKRLFMGTRQADAEFLNEANLISRVQHRNLVKLLGCSVEGSERLLVYEYLQNSSLDKILFDPTKRHLLDWKKRSEIILGTARGLAYLHEESDVRVIHRDIKASNILLDDKHRPKIADFGLARFFAEDQSHVSTRVAGTLGYMAPEYALRGQLTEKADVFSFGVLVLEIISGRKNQSSTEDMEFLIEGTWRLYKANRGLEIMDPALKDSYSWEDGIRAIKIGLLCTQAAAALRPSMFRVVSMLTSEREHHLPSPTRPAFIDLDAAGAAQQLRRGRIIDPERTSSSAATSSTTPSETHSAAADPNASSILEPR